MKKAFATLKMTYHRWSDHRPFMLSSALSYYTIFSLPALLVIIVTLAGYFFGEEAVRGEIFNQVKTVVGSESALQIQSILKAVRIQGNNLFVTVAAIVTIFLSATAVFIQVKDSLNQIWEVEPRKQKGFKAIVYLLLTRLITFGMVASLGFLLLVSLIITSIITALNDWLVNYLSWASSFILKGLNLAVDISISVLLFAFIFKLLPDTKVKWRSVWRGGFVTAVLFVVGKFLIGIYLGKTNPASPYGAAGSIIIILSWVYYSSLILFFGAAFTAVIDKPDSKKNSS
jgi:membrane protein